MIPPTSPQSPLAPPYSRPNLAQRSQPNSRHSRSRSHPTPSPVPTYEYAHQPQQAWQNHAGVGWTGPHQAYEYNPYPSPALSDFGYPAYGMHGMGMGMQGYGGHGEGQGGGYGYGTWSPSGGAQGYPGRHGNSPVPQAQTQNSMGGFWYGSTGWGR
jgi:hypothetical protein